MDDGLDEHEQADEEEQRAPLDVAQGLVRVERADDHQDGRAEQGDRRRLQPITEWKRKPTSVRPKHDQGPDHQRPVRDRRRRIHRGHDVQAVRVVLHAAAEGQAA